jgi:hypothetical protein
VLVRYASREQIFIEFSQWLFGPFGAINIPSISLVEHPSHSRATHSFLSLRATLRRNPSTQIRKSSLERAVM